MTITYPLTLPDDDKVAAVTWRPVDVVALSASPFSGVAQVYRHPGQWLQADVTLVPMKRADAEAWVAFFLKLKGAYGTFLLRPPEAKTQLGAMAGAPACDGTQAAAAETLLVRDLTPNASNVWKAGDWIGLAQGGTTARLHKVLHDVSADAGGKATLDIWPALRTSYAALAAIAYSQPKGAFRLTGNVPYDIGEALIYGFGFSAAEAL